MCALALAASSLAGVVAFYAIIHLAPADLVQAVQEMHRVLVPGGLLAPAFHVGDELRHVDELWGVKTALDFQVIQPASVVATLQVAGFNLLENTTWPPYAPEVEAQTQRCYLVARRP
jgi:SAM-dependent methyltransferase